VAITPARYRTLVANELLTAGAPPPHVRATELGSPYIKVGYPFHCTIGPRIAGRHRLTNIDEAQQQFLESSHVGKIIITP